METDQEVIKLWFDQVYRSRGFSYLRPIEAYEVFATLLNPSKSSTHLDVACGLGLLLKTMAERVDQVHGIDISEEAVMQSRSFCPEAHVVQGNAELLPYADESFDSLSCIGSLERVIDRTAALKEQLRVARPGAKFCIMVRNAEHFIWKYFLQPLGLDNKKGHQDALNVRQWTDLFENCGFRIIGIYPDQWPLVRLLRIAKFWGTFDYGKIRKTPGPPSSYYEFIFLMEKP